ncbi:putative DNA-directed RNA polymerase III subunit rpc6 [Teratosphaeria destructans]|uniref:DNA-directed RNA polymerase III subunit RPC6 n=1 Tax=Teratosphaeria destructans TaxID=418781 RepID=A0A9W7W4W2_9PEZI|nr:putative DNA-directed RNA polymerase III subunit rpc6 [Teratosphaeria destructans]
MAALPKLSEESDSLYSSMMQAAEQSEEKFQKVFFQQDLQTLADEAAKTLPQLMSLIQELTNHALVRTLKQERALCWSTRPRKAADSIRLLTGPEKMVYTTIEDSHTKAIWMKDLKRKTGMSNQKELDRCIQKLEGLRLIKSVRNIKAPAQRTYMLYHLVPSDDVTGGSFFDAGDLDESLIDELSNLIIFHVRQQTWAEAKTAVPRHPDHDFADDPRHPKKRKRPTHDIEDLTATTHKPKHRSARHDPETDVQTLQLPFPAYTRTYPTADTIHAFLTGSGSMRQSKADQLTVAEVQGVIDVLVWDEKLEKVGDGYRTVRGVKFRFPGSVMDDGEEDGAGSGIGNGLTQAPCGRCPVFDLCTVDGPVNPGSCVYWKEWLER